MCVHKNNNVQNAFRLPNKNKLNTIFLPKYLHSHVTIPVTIYINTCITKTSGYTSIRYFSFCMNTMLCMWHFNYATAAQYLHNYTSNLRINIIPLRKSMILEAYPTKAPQGWFHQEGFFSQANLLEAKKKWSNKVKDKQVMYHAG